MSKFKLIIEEPAYNDLQNIFDYIAIDSPYIAEQILDEMMASLTLLDEYPRKNAVFLTVQGKEIRQLIFKKGFRILYLIQENTVHILHCFRCEQDVSEDLFK